MSLIKNLFLIISIGGLISLGFPEQANTFFIAKSSHQNNSANIYHVFRSESMQNKFEQDIIGSYQNLHALNDINFIPGDQILFESGQSFQGGFTLKVKGTGQQPFKIGKFGKKNLPLLQGKGANAVITLQNPSHFTVENLHITNPEGNYGIYIEGENSGELQNVTLQSLNIENIFQASEHDSVAGKWENKNKGGIRVQINKGDQPTWWNGFNIRNSYIHDLGTCGISFGSEYPLHAKRREGAPAYPSLDVVIENNKIENINRDGAIIRQVSGAIMQHNVVARTGQVSISNGIWYWDAQNSVIQFNEGYECGSPENNDGGPFSLDYYCKDCTIQYNYTHDNEGPGMMMFGNHQTGKGNMIRKNVSYNDNASDQDEGWAAFTIISEASQADVSNNYFIAGPDTEFMLDHHQWMGFPLDVHYQDNYFIGNHTAKWGEFLHHGAFFDDNHFVNVPQAPDSLNPVANDKKYNRAYADSLASTFDPGLREPLPFSKD